VHVIDWQAIVDEHGPQVWRTVYRLVSHREDALDCYQETFLQAARYAPTHTVSNWGALLRQIASARALDCLRRRYRTASQSTPLALASDRLASEPTPDIQAELSELIDGLRRALASLPPRQAEVFCLREIELMSTAEVARQLGVTPDDVATWLHRAKSKLSQMLLDRDHESEIRR
jgi:RNA polymerase sigma-70 factor (ECF subfamily)